MSVIININDLSLSFPKKNGELNVLDKINLSIKENEFISILGPSGCGKTTLLKLIGGIPPTNSKITGKILIKNETPINYKDNGKIGFAFQNPILLNWLKVFDNVKLPLKLLNKPNQVEKVLSTLETVGMKNFSESYPSELSGGMKQRVNLARTLVHNPSLLLLDEPFGSLDEISRLQLNYELSKIIKSGNYTTILVTHSIREALILSDRIIILTNRPGKIYKEYVPKSSGEKIIGFETTSEFNQELKELTKLFLSVNNE